MKHLHQRWGIHQYESKIEKPERRTGFTNKDKILRIDECKMPLVVHESLHYIFGNQCLDST